MSDENQETTNELTPEKIKEIMAENDRLKKHSETLLNETKAAKGRAKELEGSLTEWEKKTREIEEARTKEAEELARKQGDVEALEQSWKSKYEKQVTDLKGQYEPKLSELSTALERATVAREATAIATELALQGSAKALELHIRQRLKMEMRNGEAVTVVLDTNGKPSALTVEELKNEFISDPAFAPLIVGSKASGGDVSSGSGSAAKLSMKRADFEQKSPTERTEFMRKGGKVI